jgi:hypothetical protein
MKKKASILGLVILGLMIASPAFGLALKFAPGAGAVWAVGREIEESDIGYNFSGAVEIEVWKGFDYGFKYYYSEVPTTFTDSMLFDTAVTTVDATFRHQAFMLTNSWSPGWRWVDPYVRGSAGLYSWQQLDRNDDLFELVTVNPEDSTDTTSVTEFKATSFGVGLGGGLRIWPTDWIGLRLGVDYDLIFSENREKFGSQDANENLFRVGGEIVFRIPIK